MIIRFDKAALMEQQNNKDVGVETEKSAAKVSEADKIVAEAKQKIAKGTSSGVGVSASNSGRGHDPVAISGDGTEFVPTTLRGRLEEEPSAVEDEEAESAPPPVRNNIVPQREEDVAKDKVVEENIVKPQ